MTVDDLTGRQPTGASRYWERLQWKSHLVLLVLLGLTFYPVVLLLLFSVKNNAQFFTQRFTISFPLYLENFTVAWASGIAIFMANSTIFQDGLMGLLFPRWQARRD